MPPSHHSSSHHSSSHHSSSHHSSSSHRSSSSHHSSSSRSYSSGPSRHSYSTHTGGYSSTVRKSGSFGPGNHSSFRVRTNQPTGYNSNLTGYVAPRMHHCKTHDYTFYPIGWTDESSGTYYAKGYYDENGKHYDNVAFKNNGVYESLYHCEYCESDVKTKWEEGAAPNCPNCGAVLSKVDIVVDEEVDTTYSRTYEPNFSNAFEVKKKMLIKIISIAIFIIFCVVFSIIDEAKNASEESVYFNDYGGYVAGDDYGAYDYNQDYGGYEIGYTNNPETFGYDYYVEAIGRTCSWNEEYQCYYDPETECYFWFNGDEEYGVWQYWFEGVSSDFASGWMEFDEYEDCWYIEEDYGDWKKLPSKYDTDKLWHI